MLPVDELKDEIGKTPDPRYLRRLHALLLVRQGLSCRSAAAVLGESPRTVAYWVNRFRKEGLRGLRDAPSTGRRPRLNSTQFALARQWMRERKCTGRMLAAWIEDLFQQRLSIRQCQRLLAAQRDSPPGA